MKQWFVIFLFCLNIALAQERQIPILPDKNIEFITPTLNEKFNLFPEYPNLNKAMLFQMTDSTYVLQISFKMEDATFQVRRNMTFTQLRELRAHLKQKMEVKTPVSMRDQRGRTKLLIASTTLSLGYYGWILPIALNVHSGKLAVALYMFTGSSGFFLPYLLTKNQPVSNAAFQLANYGAIRGIGHGLFVPLIFDTHPNGKTVLLSSVATSVVEGVAGYIIATHYQLPTSTVETIAVGGDFGALLGLDLAIMADFFNDDNGRRGSVSLLAGSALGLTAGWYLTTKQHYSRGDARVLESTALLGAYLPLAVVDLTNSKDIKTYAAASMAGTLLGFGYGHYLLKDKDFLYSHGLFIELSEIAGGLLAAGFAYLITPEEKDRDLSKIFLTSSAIGATAGFFLMYNNFVDQSRFSNSKVSINFNFSPAGFLNLFQKEKSPLSWPFLQAHIRF